MLTYPQMAGLLTTYLEDIEAAESAKPRGQFKGGAVLQLSDHHYIAALMPYVDDDEARANCLGWIQDTELHGWAILDEHLVGSGRDTMTVLHLHPTV